MFYTHFHLQGNTVCIRLVNDFGKRIIKKIEYKPTLYVSTREKTKYRSLEGEYLKPYPCLNIAQARETLEHYKDVQGFKFYGNTNWAYACIADLWKDDVPYRTDQIREFFLDIETEVEGGKFPDPQTCSERINLITVFVKDKFHTFALKDAKLSIDHEYPVELRCFNNERDLLVSFINFWESDYPDVVSGWNSEFFDLPYLLRRIKLVLGDSYYSRLSPFQTIREKLTGKGFLYNIVGVEHLDYLLLFKKYIPGERDFSLDAVCEDFLGVKKLPNLYDTFAEFYQKDWDRFVDYNIRDVHLLKMLDQKLKLLSLTYSLAYLVKMNYSDVFGTVKPWDVFIQNYLARENKFVEADFSPGKADRSIMGGFVMAPNPGRYQDVVSFDAKSLYPSIIRTWNISPETLLQPNEVPDELLPYYDKIQIDDLLKDDEHLRSLLEKYNLCMTANGQFYRRDFKGIMPTIAGDVYQGRDEAKKKMIQKKKELEEAADPERRKELEGEIASLDNRQLALKIFLNSLYGAMANEYFRFFDFRNAEGITTTGQYFIQKVGQISSDFLDKKSGKRDSLIYIDTDSNYFSLKSLLDKVGVPEDKRLEVMDRFCQDKLGKVISGACEHIGRMLNVFENHLDVKREKICSAGVWVAKKRYALLVWDDEGVRLKEPEIKVTGLEVKRSSTPPICRKELKQVLHIILTSTEAELQEFVERVREEFFAAPVEEVARPSGVSGIEKYSDPVTIYKKGTPMHVKAALIFNHLVEKKGLSAKYPLIGEGNKIKYVNLKMPNPVGAEVVAFKGKLPPEFEIEDYIDREELFKVGFLNPVEKIAEACKWNHEKKATLDAFF